MHHGWMEVDRIFLLIKITFVINWCVNQIFHNIIFESEILACDQNLANVDMRVFPHKDIGRNSHFLSLTNLFAIATNSQFKLSVFVKEMIQSFPAIQGQETPFPLT